MSTKLYSAAELHALRQLPKRVTNPGARWAKKPGRWPENRQRVFEVAARGTGEPLFSVYQRQNYAATGDFSCGISYLPLGGKPLMLARYNGFGHRHEGIAYRPHIHRATEAAIAAGRKPESQARATARYHTLEGALACLIDDFHLEGIRAQHDAPTQGGGAWP